MVNCKLPTQVVPAKSGFVFSETVFVPDRAKWVTTCLTSAGFLKSPKMSEVDS